MCFPILLCIVIGKLITAITVVLLVRVKEQPPEPVQPLADPVPVQEVKVPLVAVALQTTPVPDA